MVVPAALQYDGQEQEQATTKFKHQDQLTEVRIRRGVK